MQALSQALRRLSQLLGRPPKAKMHSHYLVAGLGNVGAEYAGTRHNIGFIILDAWAQASNIGFVTGRYGDVAELSVKGRKVTLLKPGTYMNLSGNAVRYWADKTSSPIENVLVVCDDLNLPFGTTRMRKGGSDGGHNGLKDIEAKLGTQDYPRIRVGIGNDYSKGAQVGFVLGKFGEEQAAQLPAISERVIVGIKDFILMGADRAMNVVNARPHTDQAKESQG